MPKEIIIYSMFGLTCLLTLILVIKRFGKHTNIDDPLDDKFWKDKV